MNYGWGDRVQLKYEMPYVYNSTNNGPLLSGPGDSKFGVKIRFFQNEKLDLNISTYPQLEINNTQNSVRRNLVYQGPLFLLPLEVTKKVGPVDVDLEVGRWFTQQQNYWISGLALGHQATRRLEVLGEVYSDGTPTGAARQHLRLRRTLSLEPQLRWFSSWRAAASVRPAADSPSSSDTLECSSSWAGTCATTRNRNCTRRKTPASHRNDIHSDGLRRRTNPRHLSFFGVTVKRPRGSVPVKSASI